MRNTIREHGLLGTGDSVLVGLSGGPDSVALLHVLARLKKELHLRLGAVYVNHRLRPRAAAREEKFCAGLCLKLRVGFHLVREDIPARARRMRKGVEETAREFRYATFGSLAAEHGYEKIAVGHHADDRVETILFRILRGTGRTGLLGIPLKRGRIVRPLYHLNKNEILAYLKRHRLEFCVDRSNARSDYARNYLRNQLLPNIRRRVALRVDEALLRLSESLNDEEAYLQSVTERTMKRITRVRASGKIELAVGEFVKYDSWLRYRMLRQCLTMLSPVRQPPDRAVVMRLDAFSRSGGTAMSLPGGVEARRSGSSIVVSRGYRDSYCQEFVPGKTCRLPELGVSVRCGKPAAFDGSLKKLPRSRKVVLDWEKLTPPLTLRNIRKGDRFIPLGMDGFKKVGDYLTDKKVARVFRSDIPVVSDGRGIVWLVGFEIAERAKVNPNTSTVVRLELTARRNSPAYTV
ncbi:MAG TPA: tRNA lysidine(34) synthetase TilS [Candidatus Deferrimicrobium sp.]|nr:tRNA lysidine(34) synthetase TilS [Candidatus Deferrimicrobium sp.]